jgi:hypothetical protein
MSASTPVTSALEQRLLAEVQNKRLVVWLDADSTFNSFVDRLVESSKAKQFPASVVAFRGSFLELMLALRSEASTVDKTSLVVHLPGFNTDSVKSTPLLEVYEAAHCFQPRLDTHIRETANGKLPLPEIDAFVAQPALSLEAADEWLSRAAGPGIDTHSDWVSKLEAPAFTAYLVSQTGSLAASDATLRRAEALFGTTKDWVSAWGENNETEAIVAWILCVEYVHDLRGTPRKTQLVPLRALPAPTVKRCQSEAARLRKDLPDTYRNWARSVEAWLGKDETTVDPKDLGRIDTFEFEALSIFRGAVGALARGEYQQVLDWSAAHDASSGFWIQQDQPRRWAWSLLSDAARLGAAIGAAASPLKGATGLEAAVAQYAEHAAPVDRAQRVFEQRFSALYGPLLPELTALDAAFEQVRGAFGEWADRLVSEFNAICRREGALPPADIQQRMLFDQVVAPLVRDGERTALFLLDALRYEMALELREELKAAGLQLDLRARLAELPSITAVGMNVLAPVARDGRLSPMIKAGRFVGFRSGEASIARPEDRVRAMGLRVGGKPPKLLSLGAVRTTPPDRLKNQVSQAHLLVIHSTDIDEAGESGFGLDMFEKLIRDVATARHQLEAAGVTQFIFTSDHGFLLGRWRPAQDFGSRGEPQRRYVYSESERSDPGHLTVPLASLGYDAPGVLVFRDDTAEFHVSSQPGSFTHGGNSLQERVIPVLRASRTRVNREVSVRFSVLCEPAPAVMGVQRLKVRVTPRREEGQAPLAFVSSQPVDVLLRVPDRPEIRMVLKDVIGPGATVHAGTLRIDAGTADWTEVYFVLEGSVSERLPVELALVSDPEAKARPDTLYPVSFVGGPGGKATTTAETGAGGWSERLGDADAGKVFDFLEKHGALNESDLVQLLGGSARRARAFAARFDGFRDRLTFDVGITVSADGKQYRKL